MKDLKLNEYSLKELFKVVIARLSADLGEDPESTAPQARPAEQNQLQGSYAFAAGNLVLTKIRHRNLLLVRELKEALQRLETGHYGRCRECKREIDAARLKVQPMIKLCSKCEEMKNEHK